MDPSVDRSIYPWCAWRGFDTRALRPGLVLRSRRGGGFNCVSLLCVLFHSLLLLFPVCSREPTQLCLSVHLKISTKGFHRVAFRFSRLRSNVKFISHLSESDRCELFLYVVISDQQVGATAQPSVCSIFCCFFLDRSVWLLTCAAVLFSARPGVVATWQHCRVLQRAARRSCNLATLSPHALRSGGRFLQISMRSFHF